MSGTVTAELGYLDDPHKLDDGQRLHYYADFTRTTNARLKPRPVPISDARAQTSDFTLDGQGFALAHWPTQVADFIDTQAINDQYIKECEDLIRSLTGADVTYSAGPLHCRFDGVADPRLRYDGKPAHYVHADYSHAAVARSLGWVPEDLTAYRRYAVYNIWRVVTPPPQSQPLAVCDARSIAAEDEHESLVILSYPDGPDVDALTVLYQPNAKHRWYYFSDMTPDEALVFKSFDSDPARANRVPHCAFRDTTQAGSAMRISIEARIWGAFR